MNKVITVDVHRCLCIPPTKLYSVTVGSSLGTICQAEFGKAKCSNLSTKEMLIENDV